MNKRKVVAKGKSPARVKATRKTKKDTAEITTTSVAFKTQTLNALKEHDICKKNRLSVSWVVNKLIDKFLACDVTLELE